MAAPSASPPQRVPTDSLTRIYAGDDGGVLYLRQLDEDEHASRGFQATNSNDLDGAFRGDDASRHYLRQTGTDTVWVAEKAFQPGERPGWVK